MDTELRGLARWVRRSVAWPERTPGQPAPSWLVCGMPPAVLIACLTAVWLLTGFGWERAVPFGRSWLSAIWLVAVVWPCFTAVHTTTLWLVWKRYDAPPVSFCRALALVGRVVAVLLLIGTLAGLVGWLTGIGEVVYLIRWPLWFVVFWKVFELELIEAGAFCLVQFVVSYGLYFALLLIRAAQAWAG